MCIHLISICCIFVARIISLEKSGFGRYTWFSPCKFYRLRLVLDDFNSPFMTSVTFKRHLFLWRSCWPIHDLHGFLGTYLVDCTNPFMTCITLGFHKQNPSSFWLHYLLIGTGLPLCLLHSYQNLNPKCVVGLTLETLTLTFLDLAKPYYKVSTDLANFRRLHKP